MLAFLDTEFTDFDQCDLISIGIVTDINSFYGENTDFIRSYSSEWVQNNIYPMLNFTVHGYKRAALAASLWEWFDQFTEQVDIVVDYDKDYKLLNELFGYEKHPKIGKVINIYDLMLQQAAYESPGAIVKKFKQYFQEYLTENNKIQHHALADAEANMFAFNKICDSFKAGKFTEI